MLTILIATCCHSTISASMSNQILFSLTDEEAVQLESNDEEFYGLSEQPLLTSASGDDLESKGEELGDRGILPKCELQERISIAVCENREEESLASTSTSVGLVSLDNDPVYSEINRRLNVLTHALPNLTQMKFIGFIFRSMR